MFLPGEVFFPAAVTFVAFFFGGVCVPFVAESFWARTSSRPAGVAVFVPGTLFVLAGERDVDFAAAGRLVVGGVAGFVGSDFICAFGWLAGFRVPTLRLRSPLTKLFAAANTIMPTANPTPIQDTLPPGMRGDLTALNGPFMQLKTQSKRPAFQLALPMGL